MTSKIALPNIATFDTSQLPVGATIFLQATQDALRTIDDNTIYKDQVNLQPVTSRIRARSAQGQAYSVSGVSLASGDDYAVLVRDFESLLESHKDLVASHNALVNQLRGT